MHNPRRRRARLARDHRVRADRSSSVCGVGANQVAKKRHNVVPAVHDDNFLAFAAVSGLEDPHPLPAPTRSRAGGSGHGRGRRLPPSRPSPRTRKPRGRGRSLRKRAFRSGCREEHQRGQGTGTGAGPAQLTSASRPPAKMQRTTGRAPLRPGRWRGRSCAASPPAGPCGRWPQSCERS